MTFDRFCPLLSFLKNPRQWHKGICAFLAAFCLVSWLAGQVRLVYSATDSLPYRYFLELKPIAPKVGHYTYFESPWHGGKVIKRIAGKAGDSLTYDGQGNLWVGRKLIGIPKRKAKDGRQLTPIKSGVIPRGRVFMAGDHERSFDSRYEEMGLIPEAALHGRVLALV